MTAVALLGIAGVASPAFGAEPDQSPEEKGQKILDGLVAYLVDAGGFDFDSQLRFTAQVDGEPLAVDTPYRISYTPPDSASIRFKSDDLEIAISTAPGNVTTYIPEFRQYTVAPRVGGVAQVVAGSGWDPVDSAVAILSELVTSKPFVGALVSYVGEESVSGNQTHRLSLSNRGHTWEMWVDAGSTPTIRRIVPDMTQFIKRFEAQNRKLTIDVEVEFERWNVGGDRRDTLEFSPPEGVKLVRSFEPPHPLEGKPAPGFVIPIYGGGELDLAKKKDDEIYILDFWATWCQPCRIAMPVIDKVSKEFADRGVKLFAINSGDTDGQIRAFLQSSNLTGLTVAKDITGEVSLTYQADAIPQTVIIGKGGLMDIIHVGFLSKASLETQLRKELTELTKATE
jgi:thiol-disulfide isomerase/thioredoxin